MKWSPTAKSRVVSKSNRDTNAVVRREWMQPLECRRLLSVVPAIDLGPDATSSSVIGYTPSQIQTAYGFNQLSYSSGKTAANGAGQTIAIVDAYNDPNISSDLKTFDSKFDLSTANLKVVNQTGGSTLPSTNGGWAEEISLDVEWAHSIAPGANLLLVETSSDTYADLTAGVNYARGAAGVSVVSMSWGGGEFLGETSYDTDFTTPSGHTGVTFVAASGDNGSGQGADWPATSPEVLSVGGTSLKVSISSGTYSSETGWSDSGGGVSQYEGEPEYQLGVQAEDARTVPDVAADASPSTGVAVYDSYSYDDQSGWLEFGGTSAAAPQWAGLIAVADQGRVLNKLGPLNGATNTLPTLYSLESNASTYSADFHDITSGSTSFSISAGTGYDLVTGLGSAKANKLVPALVSSTLTTKLTLTSLPAPTFSFGHHRWFFLSSNAGTSPIDVIPTNTTTFTTPLSGTAPAQIQQALFTISLSEAAPMPTLTAALPAQTFAATASVQHGTLDLSQPAASPQSVPAQQIERELQSVYQYAQGLIAQLARDIAIDLAHTDSAAATVGQLATSNHAMVSTAAIAGAAILAAALFENETKRTKPGTASIEMTP